MDVLANLKDFGAKAAGNVETAMLVIHDYREAAAAGRLNGSSVQAVQGRQGDIRSQVGAMTSAALSSGQAPSFPDSKDRIMRVKFNPAQLTVNASAACLSKKNAEGPGSRTVSSEQARLSLAALLFFDDMDTYDSFMWDKYTAGRSVSGAAASVGKAAMSRAGRRKAHSVQREVESLVSALRNPFTRMITFCWSDFVFTGSLNTVQAQYTMFSAAGRPVRAQVLLRILHETKPSMLSGWYKSFEQAFGGPATDLVRAGQKVGNLLNLNF